MVVAQLHGDEWWTMVASWNKEVEDGRKWQLGREGGGGQGRGNDCDREDG